MNHGEKELTETTVELSNGQLDPPRLSKCLSKPVISGIVLSLRDDFIL